jgi:mono/diheme cytochrome c family protein
VSARSRYRPRARTGVPLRLLAAAAPGLAWLLCACSREANPPRIAEEEGRTCFASYCAPCHASDLPGAAARIPPLDRSPWLAGPEERLIRIILHGIGGALEVDGRTYDLEMPGFGNVLTDDRIAALLSFARRRFAGSDVPVTAAAVRRVRAATAGRAGYWTAAELLELR